ncbi:uncharacterized protein DC041_0003771 [Schistosoma bovis]|uniref:Uncharacterized protein n=1 Tax=Schistosoma bovis TaxID=6184 RepID=A0A430QDB6_SCHBO|nr:uncharacterized protein DC041_0003771 [Schistosoma bovis]
MRQESLRNSNRYFHFQWICSIMIIIITVIIIPNKTFSMTIQHSQKPNDFYGVINNDDNDADDSTLSANNNYQRYLSEQSFNPYQHELIKYPNSITYKRGPAPLATSFRNSPSFSFNGDMRSISNLRHMMSGANPLTAFG